MERVLGFGERLEEAFQRKQNCRPRGQGGSWGSWEGAHDWIWMRKNWVKTEETAAFIRPPTLWSSCLICTLLLCKSVIMKRRGFFFNQRKNKQMLGGLWEEVLWVFVFCECRSLRDYVGVKHKPERQGVESLFEKEQNNAISSLLK